MRFYGEIDHDGKQLGRLGEIFSDANPSPMNKRVTLWFTFGKIRSYDKVSALLDDLVAGLRLEGYEIVFSSIDDLVDTSTSPEFYNTPESKFPDSLRIHGCNAAGGFSVTAEKKENRSQFSVHEIKTIQNISIKSGMIIYGKALPRSA